MKYQHHKQQIDSESESESIEQVQSEPSSQNGSSQDEGKQQEIMEMEMKRIKQQLKNVPYELILKQKVALLQGKGNVDKNGKTKKIAKKNKKRVKINEEKHEKNQAVEVSIYKKPKKNNQPIFNQKKKGIDPRFQSYAGNYNPDLAMKTYDFIPKLQQAEIQQLRAKLKSKTKRHKLTPHEREVLSNEYNVITNAYKQGQLLALQKQTKSQLKHKHGSDYHVGKREFNQQFQRKKLQNMNEADREKKLREKRTKMMRNQLHERRQVLHFKTK